MNHEGHEEHEGFKPFSMRLPSPLSAEAEEAMCETIGCAIAVHRALGPGFLESIYKKACTSSWMRRESATNQRKPSPCLIEVFKSTGNEWIL
jgi:PD-(D/E)XK nuclease superfamily protein